MMWIIKNEHGEYLLFTLSHLEYLAVKKIIKTLRRSWLEAQKQGYKCVRVSIKEESNK